MRAEFEQRGEGRYALAGELGFANAAEMLVEGERRFAGHDRVDVDLAELQRVDSAGLAVLLEWSVAHRRGGGAVRYLNLPEALRSMAALCDVGALLDGAAPSGGPPPGG